MPPTDLGEAAPPSTPPLELSVSGALCRAECLNPLEFRCAMLVFRLIRTSSPCLLLA
jgi:hypothetical protein